MRKLIGIESDDNPWRTRVVWIPTGEIIPVISFSYSISVEGIGRLYIEVPGPYIDIDIKTENFYLASTPDPIYPKKKNLLQNMHNINELKRLGLGRIN